MRERLMNLENSWYSLNEAISGSRLSHENVSEWKAPRLDRFDSCRHGLIRIACLVTRLLARLQLESPEYYTDLNERQQKTSDMSSFFETLRELQSLWSNLFIFFDNDVGRGRR